MAKQNRRLHDLDVLEKIFAVLAIAEAIFFLGFIILSDNNGGQYRMMCVTGIIVCGIAAVIVLIGLIFGEIKNYFALRRSALKALGKHGIRKIRDDEAAKYAYKGIVKLFQGKYPDADDLLQRALSLSSVRQNQMFCVEWLIKLYETTEDEARLLWCFRKAAEFAPDDPEVQSRLGHAYFVDGRLSNAEYCFEQALKYDPNHGYSYYSLAKIYAVRGEDDRALDTLNRLLKIQENHPLVYAELATFYAMRDDEEKCRENYEKAILCGYKEPERLSARMTAIRSFNHADNASGEDLPRDYYRRIEKEDTDVGNV